MSTFSNRMARSFSHTKELMGETFVAGTATLKAIEIGVTLATVPAQRGGGLMRLVTGRLHIAWEDWETADLAQGKTLAREDGTYTARLMTTPDEAKSVAIVEIQGHAQS